MTGTSNPPVRLYVGAIATIVMVATFLIVGWLSLQTASTAQAELEAQATKKAMLVSRSLDLALLNMKNTAAALAHSHELRIDDIRGFYDLANSFARILDIQIVLRDVEREQQVVNTRFPWGAALASGGIPIAKDAEDEALRTGQATHSDVFYGQKAGKYFVFAFIPAASITGKRYSLSVGIETSRLAEHLDRAQLGPSNLVTVFDRRETIIVRSEDHFLYVGKKLTPDRSYVGRSSAAIGVVRGPTFEGIPYQWNYVRSEQSGWVVNVGTPVSVLREPVNNALAMLGASGLLLLFLTALGTLWAGKRLAIRIGRLGVDRPPTREEFQILFESAPHGVVIVDTTGLIVLVNARMEDKFGYARDELVGRSINILIPEQFGPAYARYQRDLLANPSAAFASHRELCGRRKDKSEFPIEVGFKSIIAGNGSLIMVTIADISARKRESKLAAKLLEEREQFQRKLIRAEEAERFRLSRELHDESGQSLTAVALALTELECWIPAAGRQRLRGAQSQLSDLGRSLHNVARQMRPASLDDLGLDAALSTHAADWSDRYGVKVDLHIDVDVKNITAELAVVIYRVVQEALTNVAKHADGASTVSIVMNCIGDQLRLTVEDNGCGFLDSTTSQADAQDIVGGIGIPGMRERLALINGELEIETAAGLGTTIYVRVPLSRQKELL